MIDNWAVINYGCDANSLNEFRDWMRQSLTSRGVVKMPPPAEINISSDLPAEQLLKKCKDNNFKFVFIALGDKIEIHDVSLFLFCPREEFRTSNTTSKSTKFVPRL